MCVNKITPINQKALKESSGKYDFQETVQKFKQYSESSVDQHRVFTELGFSWHDDEEFCLTCDRNGNCPDHPGEGDRYVNGRLNLNHGSPMQKILIRVDAMQIASAMEDQNTGIDSFFFLDLETGEVEFFTSDTQFLAESDDPRKMDALPDWQKEDVERAKKVLHGEGRYLAIPRVESREVFRHMEEFIESIRDTSVAEALADALGGGKPVRRFKDALSEHGGLLDQWYAFKNQKMRSAVADFLASIRHERLELRMPRDLGYS
jgi:hypothetical protein